MATLHDPDRSALTKTFAGMEVRLSLAHTFPPMSEQELVNEAIRFANSNPDTDDFMRFLPLGLAVNWPGCHKKFRKVRNQASRLPRYLRERDFFRASLIAIARAENLKHPKEIAEAAGRMLLIPRARLEGQQLQMTYRYVPQDLSGALAYVLLLLADPTKDYGRDLSQCQLDRCQKFFFAVRPTTGRPRTKYCSRQHMQEAHQASASQRVKTSRAKRRANKTKRKK